MKPIDDFSKVADYATKHGHPCGPFRFDHDGVPTFDELRQLIRELAHSLWERAGRPADDGSHFWLKAERVLFNGIDEKGGYRIYVRDRTKPKFENFYWHWYVVSVTPAGPVVWT